MHALTDIADALVASPRKPVADGTTAGPPFELPMTLVLPDDERGRWRLHRALLDSSASLIADLTAAGVTGEPLDSLSSSDTSAAAADYATLAAL